MNSTASNRAGRPAQSQVEIAKGGMWPLWCNSHNLVRALWCTTCASVACRECWGGDYRGHQVARKDARGGAGVSLTLFLENLSQNLSSNLPR